MEDNSEENNGIFEITDFTNASPWESFVSTIENILSQWGLTISGESIDYESQNYTQHHKSEKLTYANHKFVMSFHVSGEKKRLAPKQSDQDWPDCMVHMMDSSNDFPPVAHHISRWYGVDQFILISPDERSPAITSEAQTKLMLSSVSLAINNTGCTTPIFIQIQKHWRHMYVGVCEGGGLRANFDMIHLKRIPSQFNHLSGMIDILRSKLCKSSSKSTSVEIAARLTYCLRHWSVEDWPVEPLGDIKGLLTENVFSQLPVGATLDPIQELHLAAIWNNLTEETVIDNSTNIGFDPLYAPLWTIKTHLVESPGLLLDVQLTDFIKVCFRQESIPDLIGNKILQEDIRSPGGVSGSDYSHALTKLTDPSGISSPISLSSVMYSSSSRLEFGSEFEPISDQELDSVLNYLFPDAFVSPSLTTKETLTINEDKLGRQIKSSSPDNFTARLARALCLVNHEYGLKALAHVWYEVMLEFRYRWENGVTLPRLGNDIPDLIYCLLHQKLQMLNCCIRHKISHTHRLHSPHSPSVSSTISKSSPEPEFHSPTSSLSFSQRITQQISHDDTLEGKEMTENEDDQTGNEDCKRPSQSISSSGDEFFEANESLDSNPVTQNENGNESAKNESETDILSLESLSIKRTESPSIKPKRVELKPTLQDPLSFFSSEEDMKPLIITKPDKPDKPVSDRAGALKPYKGLILIETGKLLYVPETQDSTPLTEDMLWEQQSVLSKLGTSVEAAHVRAKMQSMSLISDMQAFKAANPGCVLDDFVRWYSPRDWIDGEELDEEKERGTMEPIESTTVVTSEILTDDNSIDDSHPTDGWEEEWVEDLDMVEPRSHDDSEKDECSGNMESKRYVKGHMSLRMRQPGNMWVESWESTTPIPAYKQKRLFDDTKEAEKVLHFLSGLKPAELALLLLPSLLHSAILALQEKIETSPLTVVQSLVNDAVSILSTMQRPTLDSLPIYQECLSLLQQAEHQLAIANSLNLKFNQGLELKSKIVNERKITDSKELDTSIEILVLKEPELVLRDPTTSLTGIALQGLLLAHQTLQTMEDKTKTSEQSSNLLPKPAAREFIIRTISPYPGPSSSSCPHRIFGLLSKDEMRLASVFSEDILLS